MSLMSISDSEEDFTSDKDPLLKLHDADQPKGNGVPRVRKIGSTRREYQLNDMAAATSKQGCFVTYTPKYHLQSPIIVYYIIFT